LVIGVNMSNNSTIHSSGKEKNKRTMWWDKVERKEKNSSGFGA
jgi:hypothetical protein